MIYTTSVAKVMTANHGLYFLNRIAEQHEIEQKADALGAALDVARHPTGLPLQMEAQAQVVQMDEQLERHAADRALRDFGKHRVAQFAEQSAEQPQQAITDHQKYRHE